MASFADPGDVFCKVCKTRAEIHGCVDAGRSCEVYRGTFLPLQGQPVYYHRCPSCGFLFTVAFDHWSADEFREKIYNDGYAAVDPDYADGSRARGNAQVSATFLTHFGNRRLLDYGGGDGTLAATLRQQGFDAHSWDPIADRDAAPPPAGTFQAATAFEVFEHTPTPVETAAQALSMLQPGGRLLFSTLLLDGLKPQSTDHWYIAPRNGHISLHTRASLGLLFTQLGWSVQSLNTNLHLAERPAAYSVSPAAAISSRTA